MASAASYFAVLRDEGGQPILWVFGRYRDTLVRCADGRWRFSLRSPKSSPSIGDIARSRSCAEARWVVDGEWGTLDRPSLGCARVRENAVGVRVPHGPTSSTALRGR